MEKQQIILLTFGQFEPALLGDIEYDIIQEFHSQVTSKEQKIELEEFYDQNRRQYDGNRLLKVIDELEYPDNVKKMGLFRVDLYIPILTYIFGQAIYRGNSGIVSLYRLRNEQYGLESDNELLTSRFRKVILHELGHTFGLKHCIVPNCVMRSSTYVEDIDQKQRHFCTKCQQILRGILPE